MACVYPDAHSPIALWENVLAQRIAFRRIPEKRVLHEDYISADPQALDAAYCGTAAVIADYEFDRLGFRVSGPGYRSTDLVHWLALDVAERALADAGCANGAMLPKETTGVLVGNTLTGEMSRAQSLRLRWPYVRRVVQQQLAETGVDIPQRDEFLLALEARYKAPFAPMGEETLAGGMPNTIAGRICNQYDFGGGGYAIDGACSSSLLAVAHACRSLSSGELDAAIVGGVDVSLDPFELVGFSRVGALARGEMRVYDEHPTGFLPGEGCGFVVLVRLEDAIADRRKVRAVIRGWGVSSDGHGGLTRPEPAGQLRALQRAYRHAGFGIETVGMFEGHGTGTAVGDAVELAALIEARRGSGTRAVDASISSVKSIIGHTKAAAGIAGLISATMAVEAQIRPPTANLKSPHPLLAQTENRLRVLRSAELWPDAVPVRAGVSAFGFGGINAHVVIESQGSRPRTGLTSREQLTIGSYQDAELFLFDADTPVSLEESVRELSDRAAQLSQAELADAAALLARNLAERPLRAAIVASSAAQLSDRLRLLGQWLEEPSTERLGFKEHVFLGCGTTRPRILFMFPGQGSPVRLSGGAFARRFPFTEDLWYGLPQPREGASLATYIAQPAIIAAELAGLRVLKHCGIEATCSIGHSLGELAALRWAGAFGDADALLLARQRGAVMEAVPEAGNMAALGGSCERIAELIAAIPDVWIAGLNGPSQTVVAGRPEAVERAVATARAKGLLALRLPVQRAFHSPLMLPAAQPFAQFLQSVQFATPRGELFSTVTGRLLDSREDLGELLVRQLTSPVLFSTAFTVAAAQADLCIEVGPGRTLNGMIPASSGKPVVSIDVAGESLEGLCLALGASFALGSPLARSVLHSERFERELSLARVPQFFSNPCCEPSAGTARLRTPADLAEQAHPSSQASPGGVTEVLREMLATRAEIPLELVGNDSRLLADLHLNSIAVGQLVADVVRHCGLAPPSLAVQFAHATVAQVAEVLEGLPKSAAPGSLGLELPAGYDTWARAFVVSWRERLAGDPRPARSVSGQWQVFAPGDPLQGARLQRALSEWGGGGVALYLPPGVDGAGAANALLEAARSSLQGDGTERYALLIHPGGGTAAFFRTLHLESRKLITCVLDAPPDRDLPQRAVAELAVATDYHEARYTKDGRRECPVLEHMSLQRSHSVPLTASDVMLVSGGGKGIATECCLALAERTGAKLLLLGRTDRRDPQLRANLERFAARSIEFEYVQADVTDEAARVGIRDAQQRLGPVTAVMHAAGVNRPQRIADLSEQEILATWQTKVGGLQNLLSALEGQPIKLVVTFGSIIAHSGLPGEAHYGLANEGMSRVAVEYGAAHAHCRCVALEWSVWSEVGMGENLGSVQALSRQGIAPIAPDRGVELLVQTLESDFAGAVILSGRVPSVPTIERERQPLPLLRFVETTRVHFPGIELVTDAAIATATDPYLEDHVVGGTRLLPGVMALEAMAQNAHALAGTPGPNAVDNVEFDYPIVIRSGDSESIRAAGLRRGSGGELAVQVALRSAATGFVQDHMRATYRFGAAEEEPALTVPQTCLRPEPDLRDDRLYGNLLFHRGRFQSVSGYQHLQPQACRFRVRHRGQQGWFGAFLPRELLLGDPAARDGAIHGIQACVPHERLLPTGVGSVTFRAPFRGDELIVTALERSHSGPLYTYDMDICAADGSVLEAWRGLRLRSIERIRHESWHPALLRVYLQRQMQSLLPDARLDVSIAAGSGDRRSAGEQAVSELFGAQARLVRREDGKPEVAGESRNVSIAHALRLTLAVASPCMTACDIELVKARSPEQWSDLLGRERWELVRALSERLQEATDSAATRVWATLECVLKSGLQSAAPLTLRTVDSAGWAVLGVGSRLIATGVITVQGSPEPHALAILSGTHAGV